MRRCVGLALILIAAPASASNWILFYNGHDGSQDYLDSDTIRNVGSNRMVWTKNRSEKLAKGDDSKFVTYSEINCEAATIRALDGTQYNAKGLPVVSSPIEMAAVRIYPDSMGEALMHAVCD